MKLGDGCLIRRHQDYLRHRVTGDQAHSKRTREAVVPEQEAEDIMPEILMDDIPVTPVSLVTNNYGDGGHADPPPGDPSSTNGPAKSDSSGEAPRSNELGEHLRNSSRNSGTSKTYPMRQRNHPDWYQALHDH